MSLRTDLEQAMVDARHEAIGHPNPPVCMCRAEEYAAEMVDGVIRFVAGWADQYDYYEDDEIPQDDDGNPMTMGDEWRAAMSRE